MRILILEGCKDKCLAASIIQVGPDENLMNAENADGELFLYLQGCKVIASVEDKVSQACKTRVH